MASILRPRLAHFLLFMCYSSYQTQLGFSKSLYIFVKTFTWKLTMAYKGEGVGEEKENSGKKRRSGGGGGGGGRWSGNKKKEVPFLEFSSSSPILSPLYTCYAG